MKQVQKISNTFFDSLGINISDPFIVIDREGEIISANEIAKELLSLTTSKNICDLFSDSTIGKLNELIEEVFSGGRAVRESLTLFLQNGDEIKVKSIINSFSNENELFIFCTFISCSSKLETGGVTKFKFNAEDIEKLVGNEKIPDIIKEIKSLYPFTFIGKEKITRKVNELDEIFWVKDMEGAYALVNNKLASGLGLKPFQIEGKPVQTFLPVYLIDFYHTLDNYIKDTLNSTVMEGIPVPGVNDPENYRVIEIPLSDSENKVIAVIGIAQRIKKEDITRKPEVRLYEQQENMLTGFPCALALFDNSGIIKHVSEVFCKLLSVDIAKLKNTSFLRALPAKLGERIQSFLESVSAFEKFELFLEDGQKNELSKNLLVILSKNFEKEDDFSGFSVLIEESSAEDNLESIINKRGRMFEILIQNNPEPIFIYDTENLRFIEANEAALSLYGYRKDEFLQMDLTDLYTPEDIQTLLDPSNMAAKGGRFSGPYKHKKKDGTYIFVEISKIAFKYNEKDAHFNIVRDVTAKLELEKRSQIYRSAFDSSDDLLFITDNVGIIAFTNPAVKKYLGISRSDIENTSITALVKNDDRGTINSSIFHSHIIDTITISTELKNSEGNFIEVELTAIPVLNYKNDVDSFSIIAKIVKNTQPEISRDLKPEEEIIPSNGFKEVEFSDRDYLPGLFHDILTPINVILGFVQELTTDLQNPTPEQKEAVEIINENRNSLLNIMNSVYELSQADKESSDLKTEAIGITEIIDQLQNNFENLSAGRKVEFAYGKISSSLRFVSDKEKFQNLVSGLLKISIIISQEPKIYFSAFNVEDKYFAISLKDNYSFVSDSMLANYKSIFGKVGKGLKNDYGISKMSVRMIITLLKLLGGKFEVVENANEKPDCRFIFPVEIEQHEVVIPEEPAAPVKPVYVEKVVEEVKPPVEEPKRIVTPVKEPEPVVEKIPESNTPENRDEMLEKPAVHAAEPEPPAPAPVVVQPAPVMPEKKTGGFSISSLSCLYIEDQIDSQILFKVQMKELKEIKYAVSFEEALPILNSTHFDFLVVDINLQGEYNGLDALRIIHKMPGLENIPIIAVTAYVLPGDREKFIASGFNDFISKPIFHEKMVDVLEKIFRPLV